MHTIYMNKGCYNSHGHKRVSVMLHIAVLLEMC